MAGTDVVLAGPPTDLSGLVPFTNTGDAEITIDRIGVDALDDAAPAALVEVEAVTVPPGATVAIPLTLAVGPTSEPGSYPLELTVGPTTTTATAEVVAAPLVRVTPTALVLEGLATQSVVARVVVANEGNVPVGVPAALSVPMHREDRALRTIGALVRDQPGDLALVEPLPDTPAGIVEVAIDGHGEIAPGETRTLQCSFSVAGELATYDRHAGALALSTRTVLLVVPATGPRPDDQS